MLKDQHFRETMRFRLMARYDQDSEAVIVEELPVSRGACRVDLAIINGRISGVELKSPLDTLERLPRQVEHYSAAFDAMTLVTGESHLQKSLGIVPDWWAILVIKAKSSSPLQVRQIRRGRANPNRSPLGYLQLLERSELVSMLESHGYDRGWRTAGWRDLAGRCLTVLNCKTISSGVRHQLKLRAIVQASLALNGNGRVVGGGKIHSKPNLNPAPAALCAGLA